MEFCTCWGVMMGILSLGMGVPRAVRSNWVSVVRAATLLLLRPVLKFVGMGSSSTMPVTMETLLTEMDVLRIAQWSYITHVRAGRSTVPQCVQSGAGTDWCLTKPVMMVTMSMEMGAMPAVQ